MRVAEQNALSGADRILTDAIGSPRLPVTPKRAEILADYCRCDITEFFQLFGIEYRSEDASRQWQLAGEWITKDYFIRPSKPSVCPACLREGSYLKAQWELTFYVACPRHRCLLLEQCPACRKRLSRHRARLRACNCGFNFSEAYPAYAPSEALLISNLIDRHSSSDEGEVDLKIGDIPIGVVERLAALRIDTLFKSLWFLGHCVGSDEPLGTGHGRIRPDAAEVIRTLQAAIRLLHEWPDAFIRRLHRWPHRFDPEQARHPEASLIPLRNYVENELTADDHAFIHAAYHLFIQDAWRGRDRNAHHFKRIKQLELF